MNKVIKKAIQSNETVRISVDGYTRESDVDKKADFRILGFSSEVKSVIARLGRQVQVDIEDRERDIQHRIEQAYREGYEKGMGDGEQKERENRMKSIEGLFREGKSKSKNAIRNLELKVIDLAAEIAEKILRKSLLIDPTLSENILEEIFSYIIGSESVILKVSADDYQTINKKYNTWMSKAGNTSEFKIEIDNRLRVGDFLIETEGGVINGVVKDRIDILVDELLKVTE